CPGNISCCRIARASDLPGRSRAAGAERGLCPEVRTRV
ncbi:MAG: hypothetical protein AVDCRST_MAG68-2594, partial [uncultured Gemmatimonadetes bacterium]